MSVTQNPATQGEWVSPADNAGNAVEVFASPPEYEGPAWNQYAGFQFVPLAPGVMPNVMMMPGIPPMAVPAQAPPPPMPHFLADRKRQEVEALIQWIQYHAMSLPMLGRSMQTAQEQAHSPASSIRSSQQRKPRGAKSRGFRGNRTSSRTAPAEKTGTKKSNGKGRGISIRSRFANYRRRVRVSARNYFKNLRTQLLAFFRKVQERALHVGRTIAHNAAKVHPSASDAEDEAEYYHRGFPTPAMTPLPCPQLPELDLGDPSLEDQWMWRSWSPAQRVMTPRLPANAIPPAWWRGGVSIVPKPTVSEGRAELSPAAGGADAQPGPSRIPVRNMMRFQTIGNALGLGAAGAAAAAYQRAEQGSPQRHLPTPAAAVEPAAAPRRVSPYGAFRRQSIIATTPIKVATTSPRPAAVPARTPAAASSAASPAQTPYAALLAATASSTGTPRKTPRLRRSASRLPKGLVIQTPAGTTPVPAHVASAATQQNQQQEQYYYSPQPAAWPSALSMPSIDTTSVRSMRLY